MISNCKERAKGEVGSWEENIWEWHLALRKKLDLNGKGRQGRRCCF